MIKVPNISPAGAQLKLEGGKEKFGKLLAAQPPGGEMAPKAVDASRAQQGGTAAPGKSEVRAGCRVDAGQAARALPAAQALDQVTAAQQRLDQVLKLAQSGKSFTPAELIALQANVYRASQELDLAGKVVEKATSGVKQILQTQV
jgi:flagellar hook-basal body complex protein FliE